MSWVTARSVTCTTGQGMEVLEWQRVAICEECSAANGSRPHVTPHLLQALTLRGLTLANRIVIAPMCTYSATDGVAGDFHPVGQSGEGLRRYCRLSR